MTPSRRFLSLGIAAAAVTGACSNDGGGSEEPHATATGDTPTTVGTGPPTTAPPASPAPPTTTTDPATTTAPPTTTASTTTTAPTTTASPTTTTDPAAAYDFSAIPPIIDGFVAQRGLDGAGLVVVDAEDGIVYHEHWGDFSEDRVSFIASSSKMISAGVLMRLHDDGLVDVDAPVADVVAWGDGNPDVTPAQLVSNSSGLVGLIDAPVYPPYFCQWLPLGTLRNCAEQIFTTPDDDADVVPPDTRFRYGGGQWQVAGAVAEIASGRTWSELIDEIYVEPCGLETLGYNNHFAQFGAPGDWAYPEEFGGDLSLLRATDNPNIEGGAYSTTGDYAQLLLMHLRDGRCGDEQVLSPESLDRMHSDRVAEAYGSDAYEPYLGYGMGWWVDRITGRINDNGAYGSLPWLDLDDGFGAYLVIEDQSGTGAELAALLYQPVEDAVLAAR